MGEAATVNNVPETLKDIWEDEIHDFLYEDSTWFGQIPKDTSWEGEHQIKTVMYGGMNGRSAKFDRAQTRKSPPKYKNMTIPSRDNFALWSIDHKLVVLTRSQKGSLVRALAENTEKAMERLKHSTCFMLWGNGGGAIGEIDSIDVTGKEITLKNPNDVRNFEVGDWLDASEDDGTTGAIKGDQAEVLEVDEDNGIIIVDVDVTAFAGPAAWAADDFLFHDGDFGAVFHGVPAFVCPDTPGTNGVPLTIHGMDRSAHLSRLGGHRFVASTANVSDEIKLALAKAWRRSCKISDLYTSPEVFDEVESELQTQKRYVDESVGRVGYRALEFTTQGGKTIKLWSDPDIRLKANGKRRVYGIKRDSWTFHTALEYPMWLTLDGKREFDMERDANASEGRVGGYGDAYCTEPGNNFELELTV